MTRENAWPRWTTSTTAPTVARSTPYATAAGMAMTMICRSEPPMTRHSTEGDERMTGVGGVLLAAFLGREERFDAVVDLLQLHPCPCVGLAVFVEVAQAGEHLPREPERLDVGAPLVRCQCW